MSPLRILSFIFIFFVGISPICFGQQDAKTKQLEIPVAESPQAFGVETVTQERIETVKAKLKDATLEANARQDAIASLSAAEVNLQRISTNTKVAEANEGLAATADARAEEIKAQLAKLTEKKSVPSKVSDDKLAQAAKEAGSSLEAVQSELRNGQNGITLRSEQVAKAQQTLAELAQQRDSANTQLKEVLASTSNPLVIEAKSLELMSKAAWLESEIKRIRSEVELYEADQKAGLLSSSLELWTSKVNRANQINAALQDRLTAQQRKVTQQAVSDAHEEAEKAPKLLQPFAVENSEIAEMATDLLEPIRLAKSDLTDESQRKIQIEKQFDATQNRINAVGLTASTGAYLRNKKSEIPREGWLASLAAERISEIEKYQSLQFDLQEREQTLMSDDIVKEIEAQARIANPSVTVEELAKLKESTLFLVTRRRELLKQAIANHKDYLSTLTKLRNTEKSLSDKTSEFHEYINERILWIRSNEVLFSEIATDKSDVQLWSPANWLTAGKLIAKDAMSHIFLYSVAALLFAVLFVSRIRMRKAIAAYGKMASRGTNVQFLPTIRTLMLTAAISVTIPLLLFVVGWRLRAIVPSTELTISLGIALINSACFFFIAEFLRQVCRQDGLAQDHFGWTANTVSKLKNELNWFVPFGAMISFVFSLLYSIDVNHEVDLIERSVFLLAIGVLAYFLYRIVHPKHGMFREQLIQNPKAWFAQSKSIWFWSVMLIPIVLMGMVVVGYYYSAMQMLDRLFLTVVILVGFEIGRALLSRFILLSRRKARIEQARARMAAKTDSADATEGNKQAVELQRAADQEAFLAEASATIDENVQRSQQLVAAVVAIAWVISLSFIWADIFPALRGLDRYVLWTAQVEVATPSDIPAASSGIGSPSPMTAAVESKAEPSSDAQTASSNAKAVGVANAGTRTESRPVTLRHLLLAMFILTVSIFALRNLPAFLELMFLKHLPVEQSVRHAVKAITGYLILLIGVVAAGRAMYIGWSQIQWLATALTFGLAFGLQEIFANFIAGIILLLERPIRIGDVISVDSVTGTVSKIRIRATTITDLDRKDYIVPNKEFITGRVLNWTLSDKVNRMFIRVGIAYGSDVRRAQEIIREICVSHPAVVDDPPPVVTFEEFGDSSLNMSARIFLKDFESRLPTQNQINLSIDDAFKAEGIEISFPQRDLHIRTASPEFEDSVRNTIAIQHRAEASSKSGVSNNRSAMEIEMDTSLEKK